MRGMARVRDAALEKLVDKTKTQRDMLREQYIYIGSRDINHGLSFNSRLPSGYG
jgi:hypothetical protein